MRSLTNLAFTVALAGVAGAATFSYHVVGDDPGAWPAILGSVGLTASPTGIASVFVVRDTSPLTVAQWLDRAQRGAYVVFEGDSAQARELGFVPSKKLVMVRGVEDLRAPKLEIVWEKPLAVPVCVIPAKARVFARERWDHAPLMAGFRQGSGAILWLAVPPGTQGDERFPYLMQALADMGFEPPFRSSHLWAFFDASYRSRVDLDYFAARWRKTGISVLHVAAWHYYDADPQADEYLKRLIEACHKQAILVYAWLELPHVSEKFWNDHPEWREKTALQQDAQLDWRKLMNLTNRDAFHAASAGVRSLLSRFDWDGANLAELYFESLEGYLNPARFTPMNTDVRSEFKAKNGFDPLELFDPNSPRNPSKDASGMRALLEFRADLARRQQTEWIGEIEKFRRTRPYMDLVLTHVDDRFDKRMRDLIGADASRVLPLLDQHDITFLIEDPATIWNLGPQRYPQIAAAYEPLTTRQDRLAIDINIVERYQDVYPTKQQTGTELFQLLHLSSAAFPQVALYFENSLLKEDLPFIPSAASTVTRLEMTGTRQAIESQRGLRVPWHGPALVDGRPWPVRDTQVLWLPPGAHSIEPGTEPAPAAMTDFNGLLQSATPTAHGFEFAYESTSRALAKLDRVPSKLEIDGAEAKPEFLHSLLVLPRGQHIVTLSF
jgi:hypothetical protein